MDFLKPLIEKHKKHGKDKTSILSWIEQDLKELGLSEESIKEDLQKASKMLGA